MRRYSQILKTMRDVVNAVSSSKPQQLEECRSSTLASLGLHWKPVVSTPTSEIKGSYPHQQFGSTLVGLGFLFNQKPTEATVITNTFKPTTLQKN